MKKILMSLFLAASCLSVQATPSFADVDKALQSHDCGYARKMMDDIIEKRPDSDRAKELNQDLSMACGEKANETTVGRPTILRNFMIFTLGVSIMLFAALGFRKKVKKEVDQGVDNKDKTNYTERLTVHDIDGNK